MESHIDKIEPLASHVPMGVTALFAGLLILTIGALAFEEKIHTKKSVIMGVAAIVMLLLGTFFKIIPFGNVILPGNHEVSIPVYITAIDWEALAIIVGSDIFVAITSRSGLFSWIAIRLTKLSRGDPLRLLWYYGLMTILFNVALNNVTAMVIVGSLTCVSLAKLEKEEYLGPFLMMEALLTNIGGLSTLISSVPNIIVGRIAGIGFMEFLVKAAPFVAVLAVITIFQAALTFKIKRLATDEEKERAAHAVASFNENDTVTSRKFFWFSAFMLAAFIAALAGSSVLPLVKDLGMGFVALAFATVMLVAYRSQVEEFYKALDWDLIGFFMGLFVVLNVMEHALVLEAVGKAVTFAIGDGGPMGTGILLAASAAVGSVMDNVPETAMLSKILAEMGTPGDSDLWWALIWGANLSGNMTPIGSVSSLVAVAIMHKHGVRMPFMEFVKTAFPFVALELGLALIYVLVF